jgi:cystathionine gamma-synthase
MADASENLSFETRAVALGRPASEPDAPLNVPLTLTSTYVAGGDLEYGRYGNPSWTAFEDVLGDLEGGSCLAFASGMAAIAAVLDLVPAGGKVVAPRHSYTGTVGQLNDSAERGRLTVEYVDIVDTAAVAEACAGAAALWIETPTNPALEVADLAALVPAAHAAGAIVVVDNTFATPLLQRPLEQGADVVVHSATKYIGGHSDLLLGAVVVADDVRLHALNGIRALRGAIPSPLETFLALRGIRTLAVRMERAQASAQVLVERLTGHAGIDEVRYPGFGAIVSIVLPDAAAADGLAERVRLWRHATSLGGVESTLERRRRWPAEAVTIPEGLVRLSVGLEAPEDLLADLEQALVAGPKVGVPAPGGA